jgi:hypothetical protein
MSLKNLNPLLGGLPGVLAVPSLNPWNGEALPGQGTKFPGRMRLRSRPPTGSSPGQLPIDFLFFLFYTTLMALIKEIDMLVVKVIKPKDKKEKEDEDDRREKREKRGNTRSGGKTS